MIESSSCDSSTAVRASCIVVGAKRRRDALRALLDHPMLQDPVPLRPGGGTETADWPAPLPGNLRVDYILPAAPLVVRDAGVLWPLDDTGPLSPEIAAIASDHRLVWVDIALLPR